jgi:hypothetical protein
MTFSSAGAVEQRTTALAPYLCTFSAFSYFGGS